jgi:hypothetical protein
MSSSLGKKHTGCIHEKLWSTKSRVDAVALEDLDLRGFQGFAEVVGAVVQVADVEADGDGADFAGLDLRDAHVSASTQ